MALHLQGESAAVYMNGHTDKLAAVTLSSISVHATSMHSQTYVPLRGGQMSNAVCLHKSEHALLRCTLHVSCSIP